MKSTSEYIIKNRYENEEHLSNPNKSSSPISFNHDHIVNGPSSFSQNKNNNTKPLYTCLRDIFKKDVNKQVEVDSNFGSGTSDCVSPLQTISESPPSPPPQPANTNPPSFADYNAEQNKKCHNELLHRTLNIKPAGIRQDNFKSQGKNKNSYFYE